MILYENRFSICRVASITKFLSLVGLLLTVSGMHALAGCPGGLTLSTFADQTIPGGFPLGAPIDIQLQAGDNSFIVSSYFSNQLRKLTPTTGCAANPLTVWGPLLWSVGFDPSADGEHPLAIVSTGISGAGWLVDHVYVGVGNTIQHIDDLGFPVSTIVGFTSDVRGLSFDRIGTFNHDLLVGCNGGEVYRVTSSGVPTFLFSFGSLVEALDVAPTAGGSWGASPFAGDLIVGVESTGLLWAIPPPSGLPVLVPGILIPDVEMLHFVPQNLNQGGCDGLYAADFPVQLIQVSGGNFVNHKGDAILISEFGAHTVWRVHWNPGTVSFVTAALGSFCNQPEHGNFVPYPP
jgi:hypothetical protein